MARAQVFAENRVVCGYHFRSDIVAGKTFGTFVANELLHNPQFQTQYQAAAAELHFAHLAP